MLSWFKSKIFYFGDSYRKNQKVNSQVGFEIYNSNNQNDDLEIILNSAKIFQKEIGKRGIININNIKLFYSEICFIRLSFHQLCQIKLHS